MKVTALIRQLAESMKVYVDTKTGALYEHIKSLPLPKDGKDGRDGVDGKEGAKGIDGKDGRDGVDGKDAPAPDMEVLAREVHKLIPLPADGKDGRDGVDGKEGAKGIDGKDGRDGVDGKEGAKGIDGKDGRDGVDGKSITVEDVRPLIDEVAKSIQIPKDGRDGIDGTNGKDGVDGRSVTDEEIDAIVAKRVEQIHLKWELDWEKRSQERIQKAIDAIEKPKDGKDGRDAVDVDGFALAIEGRDLTVSLKRGEVIVDSKSIRVPGFEDQGVYREENDYLKGDGVSFGGSFFIAQKDHPTGKPEQSKDWRCAVKRGRDGKDVVRVPRNPDEPVKLR